jgi:hypothetical protein
MRRLIIAAALIGTSLAATAPAEANSIWLKCGLQEINLDSAKERFSLIHADKVYQGSAIFSPGQINFEFKDEMLSGMATVETKYAINRKTLGYTLNTSTLITLSSSYKKESAKEPERGKCIIMKKLPTAGNKI